MIQPGKRWRLLSDARPASIQQVLEVILQNREAPSSFFQTELKDLEPYLNMRGLDEGARLLARHLLRGHKVVAVGDYDCDGVTSTAQLSLFFQDIGYSRCQVVIPRRREDGYGMPLRAVEENPDASVFVAMDCGTLDVEAISAARSRGADCIVIDHHEVPSRGTAPASVLINPKQPGCPSSFKEFCTAGLTLLFLTRLRKALDGKFPRPVLGEKYLALAALGTVADIVPLVEGNRIIAKAGLHQINHGRYMPVQELIHSSGLKRKPLTAGHLAYYLAPRINAAGRLSDASMAHGFLTSRDPAEVRQLSSELNRLNSRRQQEEEAILQAVEERVARKPWTRRTMVLGDPRWPHGLVGIVASKIQRRIHYGPTIVFSVDEEKGIARGSARSVPGFDVYSALKECDDLLLRWGGHRMAAGLTVALDRLEAFSRRFEGVAERHEPEIFIPRGEVDLELDPRMIGPELLSALSRLEPHGTSNPLPVFVAGNQPVTVRKAFGKDDRHLKVVVGNSVEGIFWRGGAARELARKNGGALDIVFQLERDVYTGRPRLNIKDMGRFSLACSPGSSSAGTGTNR